MAMRLTVGERRRVSAIRRNNRAVRSGTVRRMGELLDGSRPISFQWLVRIIVVLLLGGGGILALLSAWLFSEMHFLDFCLTC
mgnify:CR=1 FL=1